MGGVNHLPVLVPQALKDTKPAEAPSEETEAAPLADPGALTVAQLQEELTKAGLDTKWNPLKGKKELVDRLQVGTPLVPNSFPAEVCISLPALILKGVPAKPQPHLYYQTMLPPMMGL